MKKCIFIITFIVSVLFFNSYVLAGQSCCIKQSCKFAKTACCKDGQCVCKGDGSGKSNCKCSESNCNRNCNC